MVKSVGQGECLDRTIFIGRAAGRRDPPECELVAAPLRKSGLDPHRLRRHRGHRPRSAHAGNGG